MKKTRVLLIAVLTLALLLVATALSVAAEGEMLTAQEAIAQGYLIRIGETNLTDSYPVETYQKDGLRQAIVNIDTSDSLQVITVLTSGEFDARSDKNQPVWEGDTKGKNLLIKGLEINGEVPTITQSGNHYMINPLNAYFEFQSINISLPQTFVYVGKGATVKVGAGATVIYDDVSAELTYKVEENGELKDKTVVTSKAPYNYGVAYTATGGNFVVADGGKVVINDAELWYGEVTLQRHNADGTVMKDADDKPVTFKSYEASANSLFPGHGTVTFEEGSVLDVKSANRNVFGTLSATQVVNLGGDVTIANVKQLAVYGAADYQLAKFNIVGGTWTITKHTGRLVELLGSATVNVTGGTINQANPAWIATFAAVADGATVNLSGGTMNVTGTEAVLVEVTTTAALNVTGGTVNFSSQAYVVHASSGSPSIKISGGEINYTGDASSRQCLRLDCGNTEISGGTINYTSPRADKSIAKIGKYAGSASLLISGGVLNNNSPSPMLEGAGFLTITAGELNQYQGTKSIIQMDATASVAINGADADSVKLNAKGSSYIISSGKCAAEGGKVILAGATISTERTDLLICKSYTEDLTLVGVKFADGIDPDSVVGVKGASGNETVNVVKLKMGDLCYGFENAGVDISATENGGTFTVTEDLWAYDAVIDGKTITIEGVAKADGSYPTITIPTGTLFDLKNGAKVTLDKVNIKTADGGVFVVTGSADANAPTTLVIGADATVISSDSKACGYLIKINGGYADVTVNGKISYTDNASGKEFIVIDAASDWSGTLIVAGEVSATASQKVAEYHLINAKGKGGTVKILDGAVLSMTLTGAADSANGINALICNNGATEIGAADLTSSASAFYASADGADLTLTSTPKVDLSKVVGDFFASSCRDVDLVADDARYLGCTVKIGETYYMSLNAALAAAQDGDVIVLTAPNYTIYTQIVVSKKITIAGVAFDDGSTTAIDEQLSDWVFKLVDGGELTLKNINLSTNGNMALFVNGKLTLGEGFYVKTAMTAGSLIYGDSGNATLVIDGATIIVETTTAANVIRINRAGNSFTMNSGLIDIVKSGSKEAVAILGKFTMNGGEIRGSAAMGNCLIWAGDGDFTVNGGSITSMDQIGVKFQNNYAAKGNDVFTITFNDGVFYQYNRSLLELVGGTHTVNINGGTYISAGPAATGNGVGSSRPAFFGQNAKTGACVIDINGGVFLFEGDRAILSCLVGSGKTRPNEMPSGGVIKVPFVVNAQNVITWGGKQYFYMFYTDGAANAPVVGETTADSVLNLDATAPGLVFTATMSKDVFDANKTLGTTVKYGALVTTSADLLKAGAFTKAAIEAVNGQVINVVVADADIAVGDTTVTITIKVTGLTNDQLKAALTIVPYVEIDGEVAYGSVQSSNAFSLFEIVISKLNDVVEIENETYMYASAYIAGTFSPYTADMQAALQALVPHDHKLDNKGVCTICSANYASDLGSDDEADVTFGYGTTAHVFKLALKANASYIFRLSNKVATLALYKADGTACALVNGVYACDAAGDYYLVVASKKIGSATVMVEHVHAYANGIGACSVCGETAESFDADVMAQGVLTKGSKYLLSVDLAANTKYFIRALNLNVVVYDAQGNKVDTADNMINVTTAATYYLEVTCTFNGRIILAVETVCAYNYKGECNSCDADAPVVTVEKDKDASLVAIKGNSYFFTANLTAGNYTVACGASVGSVTVYNADGAVVTANEGKYNLTAGTYYVVVVANQTMTTTIKVAAAA